MSSDTLNITALLEAIGKIEVYSQDAVDAEQFYHDQKSFDATMMQFVVMGEAISRLSDDYKESHANVPWQYTPVPVIRNWRGFIKAED